MRIPRTRRDPSHRDDGTPPTFVTADSHWWDGSQIYGSDAAFAQAIRSGEGGKLRLDPDGLLPRDLDDKVDLAGVAGNFWLGLALLHTLFTLEHNAICDRLAEAHPGLDDDELFDEGAPRQRGADGEDPHRRVDARDHRPPDDALRDARQLVGDPRRAPRQALEERGAQRHPGLADEPPRRPVLADRGVRRRLPDAPAPARTTSRSARSRPTRCSRSARSPSSARSTRASGSTSSACRTRSTRSAIAHPGAITLHNYPRFLQQLERPDGDGDRPRGDRHPAHPRARRAAVQRVPRLFHLKPAETFEELTPNPEWAERAAPRLRRRRARRPDGRPLRRAAAEGLRVQRHGVPRLHPDGVAAAQERPLLHARLHRRRCTRRPASTGSTRRR